MDILDKGGPYRRLKLEGHAIRMEIAELDADLRELGKCFQANATILLTDPARWDTDPDTHAETVRIAHRQSVRYRELRGLLTDNEASVKRFESA